MKADATTGCLPTEMGRAEVLKRFNWTNGDLEHARACVGFPRGDQKIFDGPLQKNPQLITVFRRELVDRWVTDIKRLAKALR